MPVTPLTQDDLLAVVDRVLPGSYLDPLKAGLGPGYEILQAAAAAMARASEAVATYDQQSGTTSAVGGSYATAQVQFSRPSAAAGALVIKAGTVVTASATGRDFILLQDLAISTTTAGPAVVRAVAQSYEFNNCRGPRTTGTGATIPGDIDFIKALVTAPDYADPTITVAQVADASGGASADLDQLGTDSGLSRLPGEPDIAYRARLVQLPDTVSPAAVRRLAAAVFAPYPGTQAFLIETWQFTFITAWDIPNAAGLPVGAACADPGVNSCFFYDDPRHAAGANIPNASGYFGRWLDDSDSRGAFVVVAPLLSVILDAGQFYDDPNGSTVGAPYDAHARFTTALGQRGVPFYDTAGLIVDLQAGFYDGADFVRTAIYDGLIAQLDAIRAGGVIAQVIVLLPTTT